jgi:predicted nucleic acid-binding protein
LVIVLDASVAVKWFVQEAGSDLARELLDAEQGHLIVPDIFVVEVTSALVREANANKPMGEIFRAGLLHLIDLIDRQSLVLMRTPPGHIIEAGTLAIDLGHPLKDCIYLALAMELDCDLLTCDTRFAAKAKGVWDRVRVLGV